MRPAAALVLLALAAAPAGAEPPPPRPFRVSVGAGGSLLLAGMHGGARSRLDAHLDLMPGGRWGRWGLAFAARHVAWRPLGDDGLVTAGVHYDAAASRPRLALALHADVGATLGSFAPAVGGGVEAHLWVWPRRLGPVALVLDVTGHLVVDGVSDTRLLVGSATRLSVAW